jgi:hypothetical protein
MKAHLLKEAVTDPEQVIMVVDGLMRAHGDPFHSCQVGYTLGVIGGVQASWPWSWPWSSPLHALLERLDTPDGWALCSVRRAADWPWHALP